MTPKYVVDSIKSNIFAVFWKGNTLNFPLLFRIQTDQIYPIKGVYCAKAPIQGGVVGRCPDNDNRKG